MTKVRLYHLAHEWQLSSTDMLEALHEAGHRQMKSHFSEIPYEDVESLKLLLTDAGLFGALEDEDYEEEATDAEAAEAEAAEAETAEPEAETEAPSTDEAPPEAQTDDTTDTAEAVATQTPEVETEAVAEVAEEAAPAVAAPAAAKPAVAKPVAKPVEPPKAPVPKAPVSKIPTANPAVVPPPPPGAPRGVAAGFRGFAAGFDPNARRGRDRARSAPVGRPGGPPGAPVDPTAVPGAPGDKTAGRRRPAGARTAISPTRRGKQATRRSGGQAQQGRGRRLERRMQERDRWHKASRKRRSKPISRNVTRPSEATVQMPISLKDLSAELAIRVSEIMGALMKEGMMINISQPVPKDAIEFVGVNWNIDINVVDQVTAEDEMLEMHAAPEEKDPDAVHRAPVVAVLGHVDHGKTSLLDYIRKTKKPVTKQEAGGITQHIGAYQAIHDGNKITFIDTPGHEAFTEMRIRGANVTDMVLLVVAADDGVMPQTKEAIQHARAAGTHIIVACNKIDKKGTDTKKVMQGLSQIEGVLPEDYGGDTEVIGCSAITGQGVDEVLEAITRYAELLELKANPKKKARGTILEARKTMGRGIVVTALVEEGTLKKGDLVVGGGVGGKVRTMFDDNGKNMKKAGPATPCEILGFDGVPEAGDALYTVDKESEVKRILAERREARLRGEGETAFDHIPTDEQGIWTKLAAAESKTVNLVLKADVSGSLQVLKRELTSLSTDEVKCKIVRDGVGGLSTADVLLATASNAVCIGFGVTADVKARKLAREKQVEIHTFRVIYELLDGVKSIMAGALDPEERENVLGTVEVRRVFKSSKLGNIAGCFVENGIVRRNAMVRLARDGIILWQGELASLRRFKDDVKEVRENFECGIVLRGYDDLKAGDQLEVFEIQKIARTLD